MNILGSIFGGGTSPRGIMPSPDEPSGAQRLAALLSQAKDYMGAGGRGFLRGISGEANRSPMDPMSPMEQMARARSGVGNFEDSVAGVFDIGKLGMGADVLGNAATIIKDGRESPISGGEYTRLMSALHGPGITWENIRAALKSKDPVLTKLALEGARILRGLKKGSDRIL